MSTEKSELKGRSQASRNTIRARSRATFSVPKTIYRVSRHPLLLFPPDAISSLVDDVAEMDLETVALIDMGRFDTVKHAIDIRRSAFMKLKEVAKRRGCSTDILINSAIADWNGPWYKDGRPKTFQEICKRIAIDSFLNSADDEPLRLYFLGIFGPPEKLGDENWWSEGTAPEWVMELQAKYKDA